MIKKLRKKFILIATLSVTAVMLLLCGAVNTANYISVNSELDQMLEVIANNQGGLPMQTRPENEKDKPEPPKGQFTKETPYSTRYFVLFYNSQGELERAELDKIASVTEEDTDKYLQIAIKRGIGVGYADNFKYKVVRVGDDRFMAVFLDSYQKMRSVNSILVLSFASAAVCIAIVYVAVVLFSRRAIDPVVRAQEKQKQFITDASHELKTPITVIATCMKVLEMEVGKQKWIDKALMQTEKLTALVNSLVTLSKTQEDAAQKVHSNFNLSEAFCETADSFKDYALSCGHKLLCDIESGIVYCGDEYAIRQLISILTDNAIKYACEGSPITVSLKKTKKGVVITSKNKCDNVSNEDVDRLFDRFWRADKSRSEKSGFGIGLSIVQSIALAHRGSAHAKLDSGEIVFTVLLK